MRIEGDTVIFKSDIRFFAAERGGEKPNTARLLSYDELADFRVWQGMTAHQKIRIDRITQISLVTSSISARPGNFSEDISSSYPGGIQYDHTERGRS